MDLDNVRIHYSLENAKTSLKTNKLETCIQRQLGSMKHRHFKLVVVFMSGDKLRTCGVSTGLLFFGSSDTLRTHRGQACPSPGHACPGLCPYLYVLLRQKLQQLEKVNRT